MNTYATIFVTIFVVGMVGYGLMALGWAGWFVWQLALVAREGLSWVWVRTPLGDWADQKIAARYCPTCKKRGRVDALLVEDTALLCPKHQRWLEYIKRLEIEVGGITFDDVRRMADPELDVLLDKQRFETAKKERDAALEARNYCAARRVRGAEFECACDRCTGKDVEGLSSFDVQDGTGKVVARYWVGKAKH